MVTSKGRSKDHLQPVFERRDGIYFLPALGVSKLLLLPQDWPEDTGTAQIPSI